MNFIAAILAVSFLQFFETRNQIANFVITPPPDGKSVTPKLPDLVVTDVCPACEGKGKLLLVEPDYGQNKGRLGSGRRERRKCPICGGKGKIKAFMNPSELQLQVSRDWSAFAAEHQGRGEIAVGEAFVPNDKFDGLSKERRKIVEEAFGHPCKKCNWTGIEACRKCKGSGLIRCTNSDCKGGWTVVKTTTESTVSSSGGSSISRSCCGGFRSSGRSRRKTRRDTKINVSVCPECGGADFIVCPECGGRRAHPCKKCNGLGIKKKGSL